MKTTPPTDMSKALDNDDYTLKDESFEWRGVYVSCIRITCKTCFENLYAAEITWAHELAWRHLEDVHGVER